MRRLLWMAFALCWEIGCAAAGVTSPDSLIWLKGIVKDAHTKKRLANVNVYIPGKDIGTMTNGDGVFSLKIPWEDATGKLLLSCLGYANSSLPCTHFTGHPAEATAFLTPTARVLGEVTVYGGDAKRLVSEALQKTDANYPLRPHLLTMFYRETIMKGNRFVGISEGVMEVFKDSYKRRSVAKDRVRMQRGRRLLSQKTKDTLAVKVQGGPMLSVYLDVIKNEDAVFDHESMAYYAFRHERIEMLDDRLHYVVSFRPTVRLEYPLYSGQLYIDLQNLCLTRAELSMDVSDVEKANKAVLRKRPSGLRFRCKELSFVVAYRRHGERSCLDYVRNTIRFKCDWKRRLFSSAYTAVAEMVAVDIVDSPANPIPAAESYSNKQPFSDQTTQDWDTDFWKDYNIIEPTESLEKAVKKLRKPLRSSEIDSKFTLLKNH